MAGIQHILQKKFFVRSVILLCATIAFFFLSTSFAHAGPKDWIHDIGIGVGGFFAGFGGLLFDKAINLLVLGMGDLFVNQGLGSVITDIWTMIRDLFNILFIFTLVYIGLRTIFDSDDSHTKKMLGMLIAAALLINFSLYIAKVVVDISNFTAVQIYQTTTGGLSGEYLIEGEFVTAQASISGAYMQVLNVSTWFSTNPQEWDFGDVFVYSVMAMIFLMFLGFVLAYGALMITARFIAIIFYLMFSPFMFLGWILPQFKPFATKWWKGFLGYSFFAPVYIFMLYIGLYALQQIKSGFGEDATFGAAFGGGGQQTVNTFSIFLLFAIGTGFLIGATKVAGVMSQGGAALGMGFADNASKKLTTGLGAAGVRAGGAGVGRVVSGGMGMYHKRNLNKIDESDAKRGRTTAVSRTRRAWAEKGLNKKYGSPSSRKERDDATKTGDARASRGAAVNTLRASLEAGGSGAVKALDNATGAQLEQLAQNETGRGLLVTHAEHLSKEKVKTLVNSKEEGITDKFRTDLASKHKTTTANKLLTNLGGTAGSPTSEITNLRKATKDQLESIGPTGLSIPANAARLTKKQVDLLEELKNDGKIQASDFTSIKNTRDATLADVADGRPVAGAPSRNDMLNSGEAIPDLPQNALVGLAPDLSKASLRKIAEKSENSKQVAVRTALVRSRAPARPPIDPTTGEMIKSGDAGWTPHHDIWEFLHRDNVGKNLGI